MIGSWLCVNWNHERRLREFDCGTMMLVLKVRDPELKEHKSRLFWVIIPMIVYISQIMKSITLPCCICKWFSFIWSIIIHINFFNILINYNFNIFLQFRPSMMSLCAIWLILMIINIIIAITTIRRYCACYWTWNWW